MHIVDDLPNEIPPEGVSVTGLPLTLMKLLGRGGQGLVYLGYRPTMDRYEVVKFPDISPEAPHAIDDFRREIHALSRLKCESIVTIYIVDVLQTGRLVGRPYFCMEHVEGGTLRRQMNGEPWPVRAALTVAIEIAEALSAAHAAGIVHRDIKPQNVLLTREGRAKLIDFGLARLVNESKKHTAGFIRGTPKYISPEAARAEVVGPQGDLYSLGALLFELLTGRPPFEGNEYDLMLHHAMTPAPSLRDIGRGGPFPVELEGIMRSLLAKPIHERPQSAGELRRILEGIRRLVPEGALHSPLLDAQDATLSASAVTVHRHFAEAIAATQDGPLASQRAYRTDAPTLEQPESSPPEADQTRDQSFDGRTGVVAKPGPSELTAERSVAGPWEGPMPERKASTDRRPSSGRLGLALAVAAFLLAGGGLVVYLMTHRIDSASSPLSPASVNPSATVAHATSSVGAVPTASAAPATAVVAASVAQPTIVAVKPTQGVLAAKASAAPTASSAKSAPTMAGSSPAAVGANAAPQPSEPAPAKSPIDDRF